VSESLSDLGMPCHPFCNPSVNVVFNGWQLFAFSARSLESL
jgi:hypothetical protein